MRTGVFSVVLLAMLDGMSCPAGEGDLQVSGPADTLRSTLKLDPFYKKCVVREGLAVLSSGKVTDQAVLEAAYLADRVLTGRPDLREALVKNKVRIAVMAPGEFTTTIPEHADLKPPEYWNKRARGLGATHSRPAVSCGEENLLQFEGDPYQGENILIHEFGHAIHEMALKETDKTFDGRLAAIHEQALREGLWKGTYAATNRSEYWAEGVQSWFDCNRAKDSQHNGLNIREKLQEYDPRLAKLLAEVFPGNDWRYLPPHLRKDPGHLAGFDRSKAPRFTWSPEVLRAYEQYQAQKTSDKTK